MQAYHGGMKRCQKPADEYCHPSDRHWLATLQMKACICAAQINNTLEAQRYLGSMLDNPQEEYADVYMETAGSLLELQLPALVGHLPFQPQV